MALSMLLALGVAGCAQQSAPAPATTAEEIAAARVERGGYLAKTGHCNDCHTPWVMGPNGPGPDMTRMLSGHPEGLEMPALTAELEMPWMWVGSATMTAFAGPWGVSYAANLTPDPTTGLGTDTWTEEVFVKALRTGRHWGAGRPILPPMPWPNVAQMTDEDLSSLYAFLQTIPPVHNQVPDAVLNDEFVGMLNASLEQRIGGGAATGG
jgi:mono/diheme cytochrome c family protein